MISTERVATTRAAATAILMVVSVSKGANDWRGASKGADNEVASVKAVALERGEPTAPLERGKPTAPLPGRNKYGCGSACAGMFSPEAKATHASPKVKARSGMIPRIGLMLLWIVDIKYSATASTVPRLWSKAEAATQGGVGRRPIGAKRG